MHFFRTTSSSHAVQNSFPAETTSFSIWSVCRCALGVTPSARSRIKAFVAFLRGEGYRQLTSSCRARNRRLLSARSSDGTMEARAPETAVTRLSTWRRPLKWVWSLVHADYAGYACYYSRIMLDANSLL